jgi:conjugative relaxase-like TrwC/TraI family protein
MLSISSGHSASYLTDSVGQGMESYYTGAVTGGEPAGRWVGAGAAALGLVGEVDHDVMHALYGSFTVLAPAEQEDGVNAAEAAGAVRVERVLGKPPKRFRTPEQVVAARIEAYPGTPLPEQIQQWRIEAERDTPNAVMFHDVTYSPVKSVTVLHTAYERAAAEATARGDQDAAARWSAKAGQIDAAIQTANDVMLGHLAEHAGFARTGRHGAKSATGRWVDAHDLTVASFYQHTSRDLDPQLHVHNAVLNRVQCPDGQWRALDSRAVYAAKQGAGAVADRALEVEMSRRLGVSWTMRADGIAREIDGVDQAAMDLFSSRSRTLTARAQELIEHAEARFGRTLTSLERDRLRRQASMATRRAKTHDGETRTEQLDRWNAELSGEVAGGLARIAERFEHPATTAPVVGEEWSPSAVIAQAVEACHTGTAGTAGDGRATFGRSELTRQVLLALPDHLGPITAPEVREVAERLVDQALTGDGVVQTSGHQYGSEPAASRLDDGRAATVAPGSQRWAGAGHVEAEIALLRAAGIHGRARLNRDDLQAWLDGPGARLSPAQREAVAGLATSDAALSVLIGPAGTGKSYTAGQLAAAWADLSGGGRVVGVATAQIAADVLRDDGVPDTANIAAFLTAQKRLDAGTLLPGDEHLRLSERDVLLVDEASMLDTAALTELRQTVEDAGARMVLMGDPRQLGAVGAGGLMRTVIDHGAQTLTLSEVRRFTADWERDASLRLRDADETVIAEYDRRGRIIDGGTEEAAVAAIAKAAAADRLAGRSVHVTAPTNQLAGEVSAAVRAHLVAAGVVTEHGVVLGRDGCTAGVGDVVQARRIDRNLGLVNRETYRVLDVQGGGLDVVSTTTGEALIIPASYVEQDVTLAYAGTVHSAQGATVGVGHALVTPNTTPASAYVGLSRGRDGNTAWCVTEHAGDTDQPPTKTTARAVLADVISTREDQSDWSAVDVQAADDQHLRSAATLTALLEDETRIGCRERLDSDLDQLVADGDLSEDDRARFGSDQGSEYLARLLRVHEQAGNGPAEVLREAVTTRSLGSAVSVAQVVAGRIDGRHTLPVPALDADGPPERLPDDRQEHIRDLNARLDKRSAELGDVAVAEPPAWAVATLGPVPDDANERNQWARSAGQVAAWREASGWDSDQTAIGRCPGPSTPEKRHAWHRAYAAAGMPEERRPEAEMTEGRLLVRAAAAAREEAAAPDFVDEQLRDEHLTVGHAGRDAIFADVAGDVEAAELNAKHAAVAQDAADRLAAVAEARTEWLLATVETREAGRAAREEIERRGIAPEQRDDRTNATDWACDAADERAAEDQHRTITETDVVDDSCDQPPAVDDNTDADHAREPRPVNSTASAGAVEAGSSVAAAEAKAARAVATLADRASQEAAEPPVDEALWLSRQAEAATAEAMEADAM